ncbi:hypothetical protein [uncultured Neglectibacter sp.]|uniref:hypothetical protein n=1 Tax=uncultured Neglectibacter sp. TaxID=1924108 RepID=UPI0034DF1BF4
MKAFSVFLRWDFFTNLQKSVMITVIRRLAVFRKSKFAGKQGTDTNASGGSPLWSAHSVARCKKAGSRENKCVLPLSRGRHTQRRTVKSRFTSKKGSFADEGIS